MKNSVKNEKPLGYILYEGPSKIDGKPIVVIVNKISDGSKNDKTGAMVQTFIIRSDVPPIVALQTGADESICGDCGHRPYLVKKAISEGKTPEAPCYVSVWQSVRAVYDAYKRGRYIKASAHEIAIACAGRSIRLGTYGDPYAAPVALWHALISLAAGHSGYSHQWKNPDFDHASWSGLVMASADSADDAALANLYGMRVFRVSIGIDKSAGEIFCPASDIGGRKTTCANCLLCGGTSKAARDIVIPDHAVGHKKRVFMMASV